MRARIQQQDDAYRRRVRARQQDDAYRRVMIERKMMQVAIAESLDRIAEDMRPEHGKLAMQAEAKRLRAEADKPVPE